MAVEQKFDFGARMEAFAYDAYSAFFRLFSLDRASALGGGLLRRLGPLLPAHRYARTNMRLCFPDLSPEEERRLLTGMWDNLGRMIGEIPHLPEFVTSGPESRVEFIGAEVLDKIATDKTGAVLVGGHFANFEVLGMSIARHGVPCQITYRPLNNGFIDKRVADTRRAYGVKLLAAKGRTGGMALLRALASGEAVGIMNDQKNNEGVAAPFFGHDVMTADGPARLAKRFGCPLVPMSVSRLEGARFRVEVFEPIAQSDLEDDDAAIAETVARVNAFIEDRVRANPEQWFWVHRRWPKSVYRSETSPAANPSESASLDVNGAL